VAAVSASSLAIIDTDLMQERMRPGGRRVGWHFIPLIILMFLHWAVAGLDRGHLHLSDEVKPGLKVVALILFALAWIVLVWAMYVKSFLFIDSANPVRTRSHRDQYRPLPLRPTSRLHGGHSYVRL
jgi:hypothetical protein